LKDYMGITWIASSHAKEEQRGRNTICSALELSLDNWRKYNNRSKCLYPTLPANLVPSDTELSTSRDHSLALPASVLSFVSFVSLAFSGPSLCLTALCHGPETWNTETWTAHQAINNIMHATTNRSTTSLPTIRLSVAGFSVSSNLIEWSLM
jgi:hypothetical protein